MEKPWRAVDATKSTQSIGEARLVGDLSDGLMCGGRVEQKKHNQKAIVLV